MRKLSSLLESPKTFDEIFKVPSVPFFSPEFNLLTSELDNFSFESFHTNETKQTYNTPTVPCEKSKTVTSESVSSEAQVKKFFIL